MGSRVDVIGSYRFAGKTGLLSTIAAGSASAGHLFAARYVNANAAFAARLKWLEIEALITTAFTAPQEFGFDVFKATAFSALHTGGNPVVPSKERTSFAASALAIQLANAAALTNGTETLDTDALDTQSQWSAAVGAQLATFTVDFTGLEAGGLLLFGNEGIVMRNLILMGAVGVVRWHVAGVLDEVFVS